MNIIYGYKYNVLRIFLELAKDNRETTFEANSKQQRTGSINATLFLTSEQTRSMRGLGHWRRGIWEEAFQPFEPDATLPPY
jgi:hypothetical protein